jgi:serine protease inhibitor
VQSVSSAAPINAWAAAATNGLITNVVAPNAKFNVLLTNAVYFKGQVSVGVWRPLTDAG